MDPYRLYHLHRIDGDYVPWVPLGGVVQAPEPPPNPRRLQMLIYGFASYAEEEAMKLAGAKVARG